jgi:hypothetical protein
MSLPRLAPTPRAALHSPRSHPGSRGRRAWLRDTTVWLALGLSLATTMVVLFRTTASTPKTTTYPRRPQITSAGPPNASRSPTTPATLVRSHLPAATAKNDQSTARRSGRRRPRSSNGGALTTATTLPAFRPGDRRDEDTATLAGDRRRHRSSGQELSPTRTTLQRVTPSPRRVGRSSSRRASFKGAAGSLRQPPVLGLFDEQHLTHR